MKDDNTYESPIRAVIAAPPDRSIERQTIGIAPEKELESRLQSRLVVLLTIFIAAGAFGIPLLWVNKKFSQGERIFWSIVAVLYSIGVLLLGAAFLIWFWNQISRPS